MKGELTIKSKILIIIVIMGLCYNIAFIFNFDKIYPETCEINVIAKVISIKEEKEYYDKYIVKVIQNEKNKNFKNTKLIIYVDKSYKNVYKLNKKTNNIEKIIYNELLPGDIVNIIGNFEKAQTARNYKGFNYRQYLKQDKIHGILYCDEICVIDNKKDFYSIIENIRLKIFNKINLIYEKDYGNFMNGILIGKSDDLSNDVKENFRDSSLSHILAISGMHVSYVVIGINFLLEKLIYNKKKRNFILVTILFIFSILTGFSVSCLRACIMNGAILISSNLYRKNNFYITFLFSFFVLLVINPFNVFNIGMWLSYTGTLGIVLFYNFFLKFFKLKLRKNKYKEIYLKILKIFLVSISAQILIFPIMVYSFNTISLTFFISNFFISFLIGPILAIGYTSIVLSFVFFPLTQILSQIVKFMIFIIFKIAEICSKIPFSKIYIATPSLIMVIGYYAISFIILYKFNKIRFHILRLLLSNNRNKIKYFKHFLSKLICNSTYYNYSNCQEMHYKKMYFINIKNEIMSRKSQSILIIILIFLLIINSTKLNFDLKINFVDVGQGDCTLIRTPLGKNIIIDGGEGNSGKYDYGENVVLLYLLDRGISRIDYLIVSHCDSDHIGGLFAVLENLKVKKIILGIQAEKSQQLEDLINLAQKRKIQILILESGNSLKLEKNIKIDVIWPIKNNLIEQNALNNNSLVFKLTYNKFSILFTGDIEEIAEKEILNELANNSIILKSTILKVAHHGSRSSSTMFFLEKVNPEIALIGVGKNNKFGHPNDEIINRLENMRY